MSWWCWRLQISFFQMILDSTRQSLPSFVIRFKIIGTIIWELMVLTEPFDGCFSFPKLFNLSNFVIIKVFCNVGRVTLMKAVVFNTFMPKRLIGIHDASWRGSCLRNISLRCLTSRQGPSTSSSGGCFCSNFPFIIVVFLCRRIHRETLIAEICWDLKKNDANTYVVWSKNRNHIMLLSKICRQNVNISTTEMDRKVVVHLEPLWYIIKTFQNRHMSIFYISICLFQIGTSCLIIITI